MKSHSDDLSYLASLSLCLAFFDALVPKILPFFRLGLANAAVLMAIDILTFPRYMLLLLYKSILGSYISGTLFSPFFIFSLSSTFASGLGMYVVMKIGKKYISRYSSSAVGAFLSASVQLLLASVYIGRGLLSLLTPFLIFSLLASGFVAYISYHLPVIKHEESGKTHYAFDLSGALLLLSALLAIGMEKDLKVLSAFLVLSLFFIKMERRRIFVSSYIMLFIASMFSSIITPKGEVLFHILSFPITGLSIREGMRNFLSLSSMVALSIAISRRFVLPSSLGTALSYFFSFQKKFSESEDKNLFRRFSSSLETNSEETISPKTRLSYAELLILLLYPVISLLFLFV